MSKQTVRSQFTKEKIKNSFLKLAYKTNENIITVKDICRDANINRSTFYAYYFDLNDLINEIEMEIDNEIVKILKQSKSTCDMKANFILYLNYIKENYRKIYACLVISHNGFLKGEITKLMKEAITVYFPKKHNESEDVYSMIISFYQAGLYQVISKWVMNNCSEDVDWVFYAIQSCMHKTVA